MHSYIISRDQLTALCLCGSSKGDFGRPFFCALSMGDNVRCKSAMSLVGTQFVSKRNYTKMERLSRQCKWYPVCPIKNFYEKGQLDEKWVRLYCKGNWESCIRYQMEERGEIHPDSMLPDGSIDEKLRTS